MPNGLSPSALIDGANGIRANIGGVQAHTADPGTGGVANKSSAAMKVPAWTTPDANGNFDLASPILFDGGTPSGPVPWVSLWSDASGLGVWKGNMQLTGDLTFDSNGNITVESLPITMASS
ncbi:hypothetical protein [Mycobacterium malmoense]|uniref:hypothetical protein n=1 Tax=Mycobacterium malmoense TaxID=1780 RepID=UPI0008F8CB65|nr:hypothetical protein [Mycobacterium malmoense]OIN79353.1 hypothetical protein BMG05_18380 [Mycobacterium malmoense]